jgi:ubiquinone/menaquinone biosynthesis C-methylase UbiE
MLMTMSNRDDVQRANVEFHSALAAAGVYELQPFFSAENRERVRMILAGIRHSAPGGRLLDVGCGTGFMISLAIEGFDEIQGIDITEAMIEKVPKHPKVQVQLAPAEKIPFADATFDVVTAYGVLHHLHELLPVFREMRRVLRPGGIFYADESPNYYCMSALRALDCNLGLSPYLKAHAEAVQQDAQKYRERYGIDPELAASAMYRDKKLGGLRQEELENALSLAGFSAASINYRWYLGQAEHDAATVAVLETYLQKSLPLSRPLFKYIQVTATA